MRSAVAAAAVRSLPPLRGRAGERGGGIGSPRVEFTIRVGPASDHKRASLALKDCIGEPVCETGPPPIRPYPYVRVLNAGLCISELQLRADDGSVSPTQPRANLVHPLKNSVLLQLAP
jgi:hypothetical protein